MRVGDEFFIATSTFEWYPGVQVWRSADLAHWSLAGRPLAQTRLLDMTGIPSSGGVWAPCLTWHEGLFYLVYSVVREWRGAESRDWGAFKDTPNFVTTAVAIDGPWSDPVYLNAGGFDASLFHDDDGRSWCVNMEWDYRGTLASPSYFSGILLQEYDRNRRELVGPIRKIFTPTRFDSTEAPHLYRRNRWYYLITAEGGTSYRHVVTVARSRHVTGPYEIHPRRPFLSGFMAYDRDAGLLDETVRKSEGLGYPLKGGDALSEALPHDFFERPQKAGHGSLCRVSDTEWVLAYLSARALPGSTACPVGRETSLARVLWDDDDWPYVADDDGTPIQHSLSSVTFPSLEPTLRNDGDGSVLPGNGGAIDVRFSAHGDGSGPRLHPAFRGLRRPWGDDVSLGARPGYLRLIGRDSPVSTFHQTVVATAVTGHSYAAETTIDVEPESFQQMAGLIVRYDERNLYYLRVSETDGHRTLGVVSYAAGVLSLPVQPEVDLPAGPVHLGVVVHGSLGRFFLLDESAGGDWYVGVDPAETAPDGTTERGVRALGPSLDMLQLSDERTWPMGFTGTFVGVACHDMTGRGLHADVASFRYLPL